MSNILFPNLHKFVSKNKKAYSKKDFPKDFLTWSLKVRPNYVHSPSRFEPSHDLFTQSK